MTETVLALVPTYGLSLLFIIAVLAAIGLPLPSTLIVMAVGAFAAGGDISLIQAFLTALVGAVIGDQIGYKIGFHAGNLVEERLSRKPSRAIQIEKSKAMMRRWGGISVFLTRWLFAPIGPSMNIICGASDMRWLRYSIWDFSGEIVWVSLYLAIGYTFGGNLTELADLIGNTSSLLLALTASVIFGYRFIGVFLQHYRQSRAARKSIT